MSQFGSKTAIKGVKMESVAQIYLKFYTFGKILFKRAVSLGVNPKSPLVALLG